VSNKVYYIKEFGSPEARLGFQAQVESIFDKNGFVPLVYPRAHYLRRFFYLVKLFFSIPRNSVVFFIHPLYAKSNRIILKWLDRKGCNTVCIVSDINSLRFKEQSLDTEFAYLKRIKYFIYQNERMKEFVNARIGEKDSVNIEMFDLLFNVKDAERKNTNQVVFAGNASKCPFINELHTIGAIQWKVYADTPVQEHSNLVSMINVPGSDQPLAGSYGLIWEGESILDISNFSGQYLRWVSPLKLSNYLLHGLPVITHKDAAMADFIIENKIGFCVASLHEIPEKIKAIPGNEYQLMLQNARTFSKKISSRHFAQKAIQAILNKIRG